MRIIPLTTPIGQQCAIGATKKSLREREGHIWINVTAQPMWADFWRRTFSAVVPAYHMNKEHWVSVILDGSMKNEDICRLIEESFALTAPKNRHQKAQRRSPDC